MYMCFYQKVFTVKQFLMNAFILVSPLQLTCTYITLFHHIAISCSLPKFNSMFFRHCVTVSTCIWITWLPFLKVPVTVTVTHQPKYCQNDVCLINTSTFMTQPKLCNFVCAISAYFINVAVQLLFFPNMFTRIANLT